MNALGTLTTYVMGVVLREFRESGGGTAYRSSWAT